MSPSEKQDFIEEKELTFEDVCKVIASTYYAFFVNNEWPAAKLPAFPNIISQVQHVEQRCQQDTGVSDIVIRKSSTFYYKSFVADVLNIV